MKLHRRGNASGKGYLAMARYILGARAAWLRSKRRVSAVKGCRGRMQIRPKLTPKHPFAEKGRYIRAHLILPARPAHQQHKKKHFCAN
jgi:hypothetical protein